MSDLVALRSGTILADEYRIERTLGAGGFGITYLAEEIALARKVTIKEYFPVDFAARDQAEDVVPRSRESEGDYSWGLDRFLAEAQTLARFNHPNIVRVYRFFQARNTGYIVLHYEEGVSLKGWLKGLGRAPRQPELDKLIVPILDALETVHAADYLHRDIAPDNIMVRRDGQPVLIDFGSARGDIANHSKTISALVKPGYSPYEQYATISRQQGPWTDIYSLGATLYEAVTGRRPADAPSRMVADDLVPTADAALSSYRPRFLSAIDKALRLDIGERPKTVLDWRAELLAPPPQRADTSPKSPVAAVMDGADPQAKGRAKAKARTGGRKVEAKPEIAGAAERNQPAKAADSPEAPAQGLAAAFLEGWRKGAPASAGGPAREARGALSKDRETTQPRAGAMAQPEAPKAAAVPKRPPSRPARKALPAAPAAPLEPAARKASPRAGRKRAGGWWRGVALHVMLALFIAAAVVSIQDQIPRLQLHREGGGLLTSHTSVDGPIVEISGLHGAVTGVAFADDGRKIVTTGGDGKLRVWSAAEGRLVRTLELDSGIASAFAAEERRAITGHADGSIAIWDVETGSKLAGFRRGEVPILAVAFAGQWERIVAGAHDRVVAVWEIAQPQGPAAVLAGHESAVKAVAYAARGPFVATGGGDATVKLWSLERSELVRTYRGHRQFISAVAFGPKGRVLASASADGEIRLWSTYANRMKRRLSGHVGSVSALAFAQDGGYLVSGGADGTVRIWDAERGKLLRTINAGVGAIGAVSISPEGRRIATGGAEGLVRVFVPVIPKAGT